MDTTLYQRDSFFNKKIFTIKEDELHVVSKSLVKSDEYTVLLENVGSKVIKSRSAKVGWLVATVFFFALWVIILIADLSGGKVGSGAIGFYFLLFVICMAISILTYKRTCYLVTRNNDNPIEFLANKPSKEALDSFIDLVRKERKARLLQKYGVLNKRLPYDQQHNQLLWLSDMDALTKDELEQKLKELDDAFSRPGDIRGFQFPSTATTA
jgi:hypothetical protein